MVAFIVFDLSGSIYLKFIIWCELVYIAWRWIDRTLRYLNDRSEANLHMCGVNVLFFKCAFLTKLIFFHACGIQSNFTLRHQRYVSSSFNRSYDYNIHLYNHAIRIKTLCVLLSCCLLFSHCLPVNKNFLLIFAPNCNTHTQGISVVIDSKIRAHLHVTSTCSLGRKSIMSHDVTSG